MQLPAPLRAAIELALDGTPPSELTAAAQTLSARYRAEVRDGKAHLATDRAALAYLGTRMPATYAAIRRSFDWITEALPDFAPATALDVGAGPGTAIWAAADCWPKLADARLIESSAAIRTLGQRLFADTPTLQGGWMDADITAGLPDCAPADLVTLGYVLDELAPEARDPLVERLWQLTTGVLVIVEPGTPAGWQRILRARERLVAASATLVAPCPHAQSCPLSEPDWCHFAARVERTRLHRMLKQADVPWEDEKFIAIIASRNAVQASGSRVLAPPRTASGRVTLKLCRPDGAMQSRLVTRRETAAFKEARRVDWGDTFGG